MRHWMLRARSAALLLAVLAAGCSYGFLFWERNIWQDFHGIFTLVAPADMVAYREMLPGKFALPEQPMVGVFVVDYLDTEPWPITPTKFLGSYLEAAVFLRCDYGDVTGWYCLVMPVTTEAAEIGGRRMGFPKYVADRIVVEPVPGGWTGVVEHAGEERISLQLTAMPEHEITDLLPLQEEFIRGRGDAALRTPIILLKPPLKGPEVNVLRCSPPGLATRQAGVVSISLAEPYDGLVARGTMAPGLFQRFTIGDESGPSWTQILFFFASLALLVWAIVRFRKARELRPW